MNKLPKETIEKVRAAIKDRATWFALLYHAFAEALPEDQVEALSRKAIRDYGRYKGRLDGKKLTAEEMMERFQASGGAEIFSAKLKFEDDGVENRVYVCALVEAWKEMGLPPEEVDLFCDIAMEGDRGRAEYHGLPLSLAETLAKGDDFCRIRLANKNCSEE